MLDPTEKRYPCPGAKKSPSKTVGGVKSHLESNSIPPRDTPKVKVAQLCLTLCDHMVYMVHGILQARILEWVAFPFSRGSFQLWGWTQVSHDFPGGSDGKASLYNAGDPGSSPGLGRSPGAGNGNLLQYYCLENPMDRGAWQAAVYGVAKSRTRLSDFFTSLPRCRDSLPAEPSGKPRNTGVGSLSLLQGIFPTGESNWGLLHCRWILYQLSYQGSPRYSINVKERKKYRKLLFLKNKNQMAFFSRFCLCIWLSEVWLWSACI